MNIEFFREYCLDKAGATEGFPFDAETLVFKVGKKIFALTNVDQFNSINLKCDPTKSIDLREKYEGVKPGYHMNKKHWNTVSINKDVSDRLLQELIDESYALVFATLPNKIKSQLNKQKRSN